MPQALSQGFTTFLRRRHALRHFRRHPLLPELGSRPRPFAPDLQMASEATPAQALLKLRSGPEGLDAAEAARRRASDGPNELAHEPPLPAWLHLWRCYLNPFNGLLTALAVLSFFSADRRAAMVIGAMVVLATVIRFVQEGRSQRAAEGLRALVSNHATVLRPGLGAEETPLCDLVAGDVVTLSAGDMVPADCRLLVSRDLFLAQAAMTGESQPVEKFATPPPGAAPDPADLLLHPALVFMGTNVVSGSATALVLATGARTWFGMLAAHVSATGIAPNAFQAGINSVSWLLSRFAAVMVPIVFVVSGGS